MELIFWWRLISLVSKSVFLNKFAHFNLLWKNVCCKLVKFWSRNKFVMIMISKFLFNFINFCIIICFFFFTKLLTFGILFSTPVNAELVPKPLALGILPSISLVLALWFVFLTRSVVTGFCFLIVPSLCSTQFFGQIEFV